MLKVFDGKKLAIVIGLISSTSFAAEPRVDYEAFTLPTDLSAEIITTEDDILNKGESRQNSTVATPTIKEQPVEEVVSEVVEQVEEEAPQVLVETETVAPEEEGTELIVEADDQPSESIVQEQALIETENKVVQTAPVVTEEQDQKIDEDLIILNWATAWSNNDTETYLSFYADSFVPENSKLDRAEWEKVRRDRLKNQDIRIVVSNAELYRAETDLIEVRFTQRYTSKKYKDRVIKSIEMINTSDGWKFISERVIEKLAFE